MTRFYHFPRPLFAVKHCKLKLLFAVKDCNLTLPVKYPVKYPPCEIPCEIPWFSMGQSLSVFKYSCGLTL